MMIRFYFLLLLTGWSYYAHAQSFITRASATTIGKNDRVQVEYIANNAEISQFRLPHFPGWIILSGPNFSSSQQRVGSRITQQISYGVTLVPKVTGKLTIPGATAIMNNKQVKSKAIQVMVKNQDHVTGPRQPSQQPSIPLYNPQIVPRLEFGSDQFLRKGENPREKISQNILVRVEANKTSAVVGEPILVTYKLFTRLRSQSKVVSQPSFTGATVIEMPAEDPAASRENINGKTYNVYIVRRVQLVPLQEGVLEIPETAIENNVAFYDASRVDYRDLYYNMPSLPVEEVTVTVKSKPLQIRIQPLPPHPSVGPASFSGAVGTFSIEAAVARENQEINATNELAVVITGQGNILQMQPPAIQWPPGFEAFEPTIQTYEGKEHFPVRSRRVYSFPFVANKPGQYVLPPVSFTYYNAAKNQYETVQTEPIRLAVAKGSATIVPTATEPGQPFPFYLVIAGGFIVLALIIAWIWYRDRKRRKAEPAKPVDLPQPEPEPADGSVHIYKLRELWPQQNTATFYKQLYHNLGDYMMAKMHVQPHQLQEFIESYPGNKEVFEQLKQLLDDCTLGMYTPVYTIDEALQHRLTAIQILNKAEKELETKF